MTTRNIGRGRQAEAPETTEPTKAELTTAAETPAPIEAPANGEGTNDPHAEPDLSDLEDPDAPEGDASSADADLPEGGEPLAPAAPAPTAADVLKTLSTLLNNDPALKAQLIRQLGVETEKPASAEAAVKALGPVRKLVWVGEYFRGKGEERLRVEEHTCHFVSPPIKFAPFHDDEKDARPHALVPQKVGELLMHYGFDRRSGAAQFAWAENAPAHLGNPAGTVVPRRFARTGAEA